MQNNKYNRNNPELVNLIIWPHIDVRYYSNVSRSPSGRSGYVLNGLRPSNPECTSLFIIAISANALPEYRNVCLQAGMDKYITKPTDLQVPVRTL